MALTVVIKYWLYSLCGGGGLVAKSCPTLAVLWVGNLPGSSVHGILQARILEWVAISFSRGSSWPRNQTQVSYIAGRFFTNWAIREAHIPCVVWEKSTFKITGLLVEFSFSQFSHSVVSDSLRPHGSQHTRPLCPSPTPGVYPNSCPSNRWCHPAISSSIVPFSSCPQPLPASGPFPSQLFAWGGQSIGVSASASVLPMNTQDWPPLGWTGWISLQSKDSQVSSPKPQFKSINSSAFSFLHHPTLTSIPDHWKNHNLD